uniref:Uncharacterized protein n=1 Tax=Anguilla anguilla TaxID=7936 RepID=A0A0E9RWV0_ANGAN
MPDFICQSSWLQPLLSILERADKHTLFSEVNKVIHHFLSHYSSQVGLAQTDQQRFLAYDEMLSSQLT